MSPGSDETMAAAAEEKAYIAQMLHNKRRMQLCRMEDVEASTQEVAGERMQQEAAADPPSSSVTSREGGEQDAFGATTVAEFWVGDLRRRGGSKHTRGSDAGADSAVLVPKDADASAAATAAGAPAYPSHADAAEGARERGASAAVGDSEASELASPDIVEWCDLEEMEDLMESYDRRSRGRSVEVWDDGPHIRVSNNIGVLPQPTGKEAPRRANAHPFPT